MTFIAIERRALLLSDDTKVEQSYANQNGALKSYPSEQRSDVKKGKNPSLSTKGGYIYMHTYIGMLGWTTLVCMIAKALYTHIHAVFLLSSFLHQASSCDCDCLASISLKACRLVSVQEPELTIRVHKTCNVSFKSGSDIVE